MNGADEDRASEAITVPQALQLLRQGEMKPLGAIPWSSNYALLFEVAQAATQILAIYKPRRGERPLWDFPAGSLYLREYAAWQVSEALGWQLVPPTVLRDGPYGPGSLQVFIDSDPELHYFNVFPDHADDYRRIALFDAVINNADRKAGHCLVDAQDHMWSIDHGICFHADAKLRTVIWDFAGEPIPPDLGDDLCALESQLEPGGRLQNNLALLLSPEEMKALGQRLRRLLTERRFPRPDPARRNHPWPPI
ncbi:MAG: SCO1664 family protein [Caldilineales bacterium]|nr:SCO1664 family protein [Caldilineales bacterium]MCW5861166.1 SCO1664 family protein [Caldilineales bacterium]